MTTRKSVVVDYPTLFKNEVAAIKQKILNNPKVTDEDTHKQIKNILTMMRDEHERSPARFERMASRTGTDGSGTRWLLRPMTQIYVKGAFNREEIEHHGVYIGYDIVLEVAAETCATVVRGAASVAENLEQCLGVSMLSNFGAHHADATAKQRTIYTLNPRARGTLAFDEENYVKKAFARSIALLEENSHGWRYNLLTKNCQHAANCVTTGKKEMQQLATPRRLLSWVTGGQAPDLDAQQRVTGRIYV